MEKAEQRRGPAEERWSAPELPGFDFQKEGFLCYRDDSSLDGMPHTWYVYCPRGVNAGRSIPLVLSLHGARALPERHAAQTQWHVLAKKYGFLLVYPQCSQSCLEWNPGADPCLPDDFAYLSALLSRLLAEFPIDRERIYLTGFSHGAMMALAFGLAHPELFAAVSANSSYLSVLFSDSPILCPHKERYTVAGKLKEARQKGLRMPAFLSSGYAEGMWPMLPEDSGWQTIRYLLEYNGLPVRTLPEQSPFRYSGGETHISWGEDGRFELFSWYDPELSGAPFGLVNVNFAHGLAHEADPRQFEAEYLFLRRYRRKADGTLEYLRAEEAVLKGRKNE